MPTRPDSTAALGAILGRLPVTGLGRCGCALSSADDLTLPRVVRFWLPLAGTWLMMAAEGPILAAVIARLAEPAYNLAAYGVAYSLALIVEAPVIMIMSAATALVRDRDSYLALRRYTTRINVTLTVILLVLILPPVFEVVAGSVLGLSHEVSRRTLTALTLLLPWPALIGVRRFYQGILIRRGLTRRVAYGTVTRLAAMAGTAAATATWSDLPGAAVGAAALSAGVSVEALASFLMARAEVRRVLTVAPEPDVPTLDARRFVAFYTPLALTSLLALAVHPMVTFFMGHARAPLESLAVLPVVSSLVFLFRSLGLAAQEVFIALAGDHGEGVPVLRRFALLLGLGAAGGLTVIAWTPLAGLWFETLSGLPPALADFARLPARVLAPLPGLTVLLCFQRAMLVNSRHTTPVTWASALEVVTVAAVLAIGVHGLDLVGVAAAAAALLLGRAAANLSLASPLARRATGARP